MYQCTFVFKFEELIGYKNNSLLAKDFRFYKTTDISTNKSLHKNLYDSQAGNICLITKHKQMLLIQIIKYYINLFCKYDPSRMIFLYFVCGYLIPPKNAKLILLATGHIVALLCAPAWHCMVYQNQLLLTM